MKNFLTLSLFLIVMNLPLTVTAQNSGTELEAACIGETDLLDGIVALIQGETVAAGVMSADELSQVAAVLNDSAVASLSVSDKFKAVIAECSSGHIFQERNAAYINGQ